MRAGVYGQATNQPRISLPVAADRMLALAGIEPFVEVTNTQGMVVAVLVGDVLINHPPILGSEQDHIRFNRARGVNDHPGADAAVVAHAAAQYRAVALPQFAAGI